MKKDKKYLLIGMMTASLFLSGCGTGVFELTAEEEELIVHSAAYFVAKHNIQQKDGISNLIIVEETESEFVSEPESETSTQIESEDTQIQDGEGNSSSEEAPPVETGISLAKAIGHDSDLTVTYEGSYLADNYIEGSAYSVDAQEGSTFYVMKFKMTNHSTGDVEVNTASINPIFKLTSGDVSVKSEVTFLNSDFSTYIGTIAAGQSVDTILLFEVSDANAEKISTPTLHIIIDNNTEKIAL